MRPSPLGQPTSGDGMNFFTVLLIVFVVLKLAGLVAWSWWWVTAPLWIPLALAVLGVALFQAGRR